MLSLHITSTYCFDKNATKTFRMKRPGFYLIHRRNDRLKAKLNINYVQKEMPLRPFLTITTLHNFCRRRLHPSGFPVPFWPFPYFPLINEGFVESMCVIWIKRFLPLPRALSHLKETFLSSRGILISNRHRNYDICFKFIEIIEFKIE